MTAIAEKSALETIVMHTPAIQSHLFLAASAVVRQAVYQQEGTTLVLPLRGAMPMYWAADGVEGLESSALRGGQTVEMPLGTYEYTHSSGVQKTASPEKNRKKGIIYQCLDAAPSPIESLTMLDEVQRGGTVGPLVDYTLRYARDHDVQQPIRLIATQDSRVKTAAQPKTQNYHALATNSVRGVAATVVPMPLIACDRDPLLDRVVFSGVHPYSTEDISHYELIRNFEAEGLFRGLGTMMRRPEIAHDADFVRNLVDTQKSLSEKAAGRIDDWMAKVVLSRFIR